ncbi:MAG TPA: hypothetical protein VHL98_12275 [Microvirga sp.]|nr:hypothetical protein [Microvirga sp.]
MSASNDNSPAAAWAWTIAEAYAESLRSRPLTDAMLDVLRQELARQIEIGLAFKGTIWLLHANHVLDTWDRERGVSDDTLRIVEAEGAFTMKPRSRAGPF